MPKAKPFALVGVFDTPATLYHACEGLRDGGYTRFDAHTPFPVHGLEKAMGVKQSRLPWISLVCAILGGTGIFALEAWIHSAGYPLNISGKPHFAFQAYIPVMFEITVLLCAFGTFFGLWGLNKLPQLFHPVMQHSKFTSASDDRFLVSIECDDPRYDEVVTRQLFEELGAKDIEEVAA